MHFFKSLVVCASALAALVAAQDKLQFTAGPPGAVEAGKTVTLKWTGGQSDQPVTILLREGPSTNLKTVSTITSSATGGTFEWTVPSDIKTAPDYALEIQQSGSAPNFWTQFAAAGGTAAASSAASSSASSSASASSSSASASSSSASESKSVSSLVSSLSSKLSSVTASTASAGTTGLPHTRNSTSVTRASLSSTARSTSASASRSSSASSTSGSSSSSSASSAAAPSDTGNAGAGLKSNAALVLGVVAAMAYLG